MVDEKGKLFGKINIIDLLVLIVVIIVAIVLGIRLLGKSNYLPTAENQGATIEYVARVSRMDPAAYEAVKAHIDSGENQLMASGEMLDAYITGMTVAPNVGVIETADGRRLEVEDPYYVDVYFTIRANVANPITRLIGTQEVRVGKNHLVKTVGIEFNGLIITCDIVS